jgi:2-oxoglutarate dehydrogenase E1 component
VRISGQDVERATFAQRHAVFHDQKTNATYTQLQHISPKQARFTITNSPLSEYGVLGYETGYALHDPNSLVMWEAQFGDFANGATIIFDQFITSGESKWNQQQAVVVSMPHGYDGNGPEHSSGRIERYLLSVNEDSELGPLSVGERHHRVNIEVAYPSTPAQYFHLLRRHVSRNFRKPLINFFSKQFLRAPNVSTIDELIHGEFQPVIGDPSCPPSQARRVVFCTGQIYHILNKYRLEVNNKDVAIVRVEQLSPFPVAEVMLKLEEYGHAELMWVQEEPKNMGMYTHMEPRFEFYTRGTRTLQYNGRAIAASPSTGYKNVHDKEQRDILERAFA